MTYLEYMSLANQSETSELPILRVAILRNYTVEPLLPLIRGMNFLRGFRTEFVLFDLNVIEGEVFNPGSRLYSERFDLGLLFLFLEPLSERLFYHHSTLSAQEIETETQEVLSKVSSLVLQFRKLSKTPILISNFVSGSSRDLGTLETAGIRRGLSQSLAEMNKSLLQVFRDYPGVYCLDLQSLVLLRGVKNSLDDRQWYISMQPYTRDFLIDTSNEITRMLFATQGISKKCIVLDCDNTLWGGIVGEDGLNGIKLGGGFPGIAYKNFQRVLFNLSRRGVLLALCSKNNEADVLEVFDSHSDMVLRRDHLSAWRINWQDKATNISELAKELNLGLESFVFVDDNAVECGWVKSQLPEVSVVHLDGAPTDYISKLLSPGFFDTVTFSEEDRTRSDQYVKDRQRQDLQKTAGSYEGYLRSLGMTISVSAESAPYIGRVSQLTQKTNQFNLTTKRYTEPEIAERITSEKHQVYHVVLKDKISDLGLIGVAIVEDQEDSAVIDTLLLSCRVLARGVEDFVLKRVINDAFLRGKNKVIGRYLPTKKNSQVAGFYASFGFNESAEKGIFMLDLKDQNSQFPLPYPDWIKEEE